MNISRGLFATLAAASVFVLAAPLEAHAHSGHHGGAHHGSSSALHVGVSRGYRSGGVYHHGTGRHGRGHHRGRHWGSRVYFSFHAPLYVPLRRETVLVQERRASVQSPRALPDMPSLTYIPRAAQTASSLTRDRRECERWAWRTTRPDPRASLLRTVRSERVVTTGTGSENILHPAATGAALGALGGAFAGDAGAGAAIGALVGATSWLLSGGAAPRQQRVEREVLVDEYVPVGGPDPYMLRRALTDCMQTRGYTVR